MNGQDVVVLLKLVSLGDQASTSTYARMAEALFLSPSQVHAAIRRLEQSGLCMGRRPNRRALLEFLMHGIRYVFPPGAGFLTRGLPTGLAAPFFGGKMVYPENGIPVMPWPEGRTHGIGIQPLYREEPRAANADPSLYELLALVDTLRAGSVRERELARPLLEQRLLARE